MRFKATLDDLTLVAFLPHLFPLALVDLPFSLTADIVMFPLDYSFYYFYMAVSEREKERIPKISPNLCTRFA